MPREDMAIAANRQETTELRTVVSGLKTQVEFLTRSLPFAVLQNSLAYFGVKNVVLCAV
jgi:hypothetical protein